MRKQTLPAVVVALVALCLGAFWIATGPTAHVAPPTAAQSPTDVVRTYVEALEARDFGTVHAIEPRSEGVEGMSRWSFPHPSISDMVVLGTRPLNREEGGQTAATGWAQAVAVDTRATLHAFDGTSNTEQNSPWTFLLARRSDSEPWQIVDQGRG